MHAPRGPRVGLPAALLLALLSGAALLLPSAAMADSSRDLGDSTSRGNTTIGIRTATAHEADDRSQISYELAPKQTKIDHVAVSNFSEHAATVRLLPRDATSTPQAPFAVQSSQETPRDVGAWVALERSVLKIPARSQMIVPLQIGVPYNATPGDHVGAIVVSLLAKEQRKSGEVVVDHRVGLRLRLRVPGALTPRLEVRQLREQLVGPWRALGVARSHVDYTVVNTGNVTVSGRQVVKLHRAYGLLPDVRMRAQDLGELLPGGSATVHLESGTIAVGGPVRADVDVTPVLKDTVQTKAADHASVSVFHVPWGLLLVIALLVLIAYLLWRRSRRGRAAAAQEPTTAVDRALEGQLS